MNAKEWTQLANHFELVSIVGLEGKNLAVNAETLANEIQQLATQIQTHQAILRNLDRMPDTVLTEAMEPVQRLHGVMAEARSVAADGQRLDEFLRSDLITDPLFDGQVLSDARLAERFDQWLEVWDGSLEAGLQQVGLTFEDIESEAQLLDQISNRLI